MKQAAAELNPEQRGEFPPVRDAAGNEPPHQHTTEGDGDQQAAQPAEGDERLQPVVVKLRRPVFVRIQTIKRNNGSNVPGRSD